MGFYASFRLLAFALLLVLSAIILGLGANRISYYHSSATWMNLTLVAACLSLVVGITVLVVDRLRNDAFTSLTIVELVWTIVLGAVWLAASGLNASNEDLKNLNSVQCSDFGGYKDIVSRCSQLKAMEASPEYSRLDPGLTKVSTGMHMAGMAHALGLGTGALRRTNFFERESFAPPVMYHPHMTASPTEQKFAPPAHPVQTVAVSQV
ncbi:hypothetical protein BKA62DRAFT_833635 [Auriculariales sp. MPI-PUGE-AT-0066]|nr:hypothetical protein BKA62DRAFT_833635 [Auriculariales sp. MPI-PUGE-AT-0066]